MSALPTPTITHCLMVSIDITHNVYKTFSAIGLTLRLVFSRDFNNAMLKKGTASATKALTNYLPTRAFLWLTFSGLTESIHTFALMFPTSLPLSLDSPVEHPEGGS